MFAKMQLVRLATPSKVSPEDLVAICEFGPDFICVYVVDQRLLHDQSQIPPLVSINQIVFPVPIF